MNRSLLVLCASLLTLSSAAFGADGVIAIKTPFQAKDTMNQFEENAKQRGLWFAAGGKTTERCHCEGYSVVDSQYVQDVSSHRDTT